MGFSVHLEDELVEALEALAEREHRSRNALIRDAVRAFIEQHRPRQWPDEVRRLAGAAPDMEPFESHRAELEHPSEDPLA